MEELLEKTRLNTGRYREKLFNRNVPRSFFPDISWTSFHISPRFLPVFFLEFLLELLLIFLMELFPRFLSDVFQASPRHAVILLRFFFFEDVPGATPIILLDSWKSPRDSWDSSWDNLRNPLQEIRAKSREEHIMENPLEKLQ